MPFDTGIWVSNALLILRVKYIVHNSMEKIVLTTYKVITTNAWTYAYLHRYHRNNIVICVEDIVEAPQTHVIVTMVGWTSTGINMCIYNK